MVIAINITSYFLYMVSLLPTKVHEILFSSFRGVALTNCVADRRTDRQDKNNMSPHQSGGRHNNCNWVISATFTTLLTDGYSYKHNILFLITYLIEHIHLYNTQSVHMLSWLGQLFHVQNRIMKSLFNKGIIIQKDIEEVLYMYRINL
jgi:hypothetical protein